MGRAKGRQARGGSQGSRNQAGREAEAARVEAALGEHEASQLAIEGNYGITVID